MHCFCTVLTRMSCLPGLRTGKRENTASVSKRIQNLPFRRGVSLALVFLISFPLLLLIMRNVVLATTGRVFPEYKVLRIKFIEK